MRSRTFPYLLFFTTGMFTLAAQALLFREYLVSFNGNELGIALFFGFWLLWIAIGSLIALIIDRRFGTARLFLPAAAIYPVLTAVQFTLIVTIRLIAGIESFELFPLRHLFILTFLANAPVSFLTGFIFPSGCSFAASIEKASNSISHGNQAKKAPGQLAAIIYALEALGGFAGGIVVTILLWKSIAPFMIFTIFSSLFLAVLILSAFQLSKIKEMTGYSRSAASIGAVILVIFLSTLLPQVRNTFSRDVEELRWRSTFPGAELVETAETPFQKVSIAGLQNQKAFLSNGRVVDSTAETVDRELSAALLFAESTEDVRHVLVLGPASEGLIPFLLKYGIESLDVVTVDQAYHELVVSNHDERVRHALKDDRVKIHFADPRDYIKELGEDSSPRFEMIFVNLSDPETAFLNRFFTVEFYSDALNVLSAGGILATRITLGENYAGTEVVQYGRSVFQSMQAVFEEVIVTPGEQAWLFASPSKGVVTLDANTLESRFRKLEMKDDAIRPEIFSSLVPKDRVSETKRLFEDPGGDAPGSLLNTDSRPVSYFLNLLILVARHNPDLARLLRVLRSLGFCFFLTPLLVFLGIRLLYRNTTVNKYPASSFNGAVLLTISGGVSICLNILLLTSFQNRFGHLFLSVGLLSALFMLGLFAGGVGGTRLIRSASSADSWPAHTSILLLTVFCVLLPAAAGSISDLPSNEALLIYYAFFLLAGSVSGFAFPVAGLYVEGSGKDVGFVSGILEAADHWGGAFGAGIAGILVLPVLGVAGTGWLLACSLICVCCLFAFEQAAGFGGRIDFPPIFRLRNRLDEPLQRPAEQPRFVSSFYRPAGFAAAGFVITIILLSNMVSGRMSAPRVRLDQEWIKNRFGVMNVREVEEPFIHYLAGETGTNDFIRVLAASRAVAPNIEGYGGPINLLVSAGKEGEFDGISIIKSMETPTYLYGIDEWFSQFSGWPFVKQIVLGKGEGEIDALTGATVTCRAISEILEQCRVEIATDVLNIPAVSAEKQAPWDLFDRRTLYVVLALLTSIPVFLRGNRTVRNGFILINLILAGFIFNLQFSLLHIVQLLSGRLPSHYSPDLFMLVTGILLFSALFGQIYCGQLCPFGAAQELLGKFFKGGYPSRSAVRHGRKVKFGVLLIVLAVFFLNRSPHILDFDPLQAAFGFHYRKGMILLLLVIGLFSMLFTRFWCRYLCPTGAFLSLFNRVGLLLRRIRPKVYNLCDLGVESAYDLDCIQCNRCISREKNESLARPEVRDGIGTKGWNLFLASGIVLCLITSALMVSSPLEVSGTGILNPLSAVRTIDPDLIRRQIQEDRLSGKEAMFYGPPGESGNRGGIENGENDPVPVY